MQNSPTVFVDTTVLLRADDQSPQVAARRETARQWLEALWQRRAGRVSTQVLNEYYATATGKLGLSQGDARAKLRRLQLWQPWQIDHRTMETAWGVEARFGLDYGDALVVASAAQAGCRFVLTEGMAHGLQMDSVTLIHPDMAKLSLLD